MTDSRPEPKYGQYGPTPIPVEPAPPIAAEQVIAPAPRRTWDLFVTTALLMLGVIDVVTGFGQFTHLADALRAAYAAQKFGAFTSGDLATAMGIAINVVRITVLVAAIVVSLLLIRRGRLAFWVPLAGAAVAGVFVVACVLIVILSDPALAAYVANQSATP
ncbi:MAG: hypothetical protein JWP19_1317 [Rhodoglobus sp.]|jgi:hypothetical protein|nr:hypothetical protein [Rhodoglobus sp.]